MSNHRHRRLHLWSVLALLLMLGGCATPRHATVAAPSQAQRDTVLLRLALDRSRNFHFVAARLATGIDTAWAWAQLDTLLSQPTGDIFWMYPATGLYFYCRDKLDRRRQERFRTAWGVYTPYRGDTENHFLMYYSSLLLFSQEWPAMTGKEWFNGKSSAENYAEAREYLDHWVDETARQGLTEWDSPRYQYFYIVPILLVRDFAVDSTLRRRFDMILEYLLADFAVDYLNGSYCGAHSRDNEDAVIDPRQAFSAAFSQFYFEDSVSYVLPDLAFAAMSDFRCPVIIRDIAHSRDSAFVARELKRSRAKMRFSSERSTPIYKYNFMAPDYCLGSMQGGIQQPIQQHSWDITFGDRRSNNTVFGLNPHASAQELGTFFPEEPELMLQNIGVTKASYRGPDKWVGGSPYETIHQWKNRLAARYDIPANATYSHIDLFFPKSLDVFIQDTLGWVVGRMGNAFFGIYLIDHGGREWVEEAGNRRLRSHDTTAQYLVECSSEQEMTFAAFIHRLTHPASIIDPDIVTTDVTDPLSYAQAMMEQIPRLQIASQSNAQLFDSPYLQSAAGSGILFMQSNGRTRVLDFIRNEVREK